MPEIEIVISADGTVTVEAVGVIGASCIDLTRALEEALGSVESRECKVQFYEQAVEGQEIRQRGG